MNLAGLPNTFTWLLLNLLNRAVIHLPVRASERQLLEKGVELQSCFPSVIFTDAKSNREILLNYSMLACFSYRSLTSRQKSQMLILGFLFNENLCC